MTEAPAAAEAAQRIRNAFDRMRRDLPQLTIVFDAFEDLFAEQAAFKTELPRKDLSDVSINPALFSQGRPILDREALAVSRESLRMAASRLIPAMRKGFPKMARQMEIIGEAFEKSDERLGSLSAGICSPSEEELEELAARLELEPGLLEFVLNQLVRPFAHKAAEGMEPLPENLRWFKGYCPVCGAWPELGFLEGLEGRRWLRCSFCGHEWTYDRTSCPFCESPDAEDIELFYSEDRDSERAELCHKCKKYLVSIDVRNRAAEVVRETSALGLVYLDLLAQEMGFSPGAICAWNVVKK